ncbi:hypothetical protein QE152_g31449 [Popillia japonica]|uniref:Uncharacterized protein n=1 Tax=Popillia japonica TaxID=7064 RepID=A0AAW1J1E6_POPJA
MEKTAQKASAEDEYDGLGIATKKDVCTQLKYVVVYRNRNRIKSFSEALRSVATVMESPYVLNKNLP